MRTITIEQFEELVSSEGWTHDQSHEIEARNYLYLDDCEDENGTPAQKKRMHAIGHVCIVSSLGDVEITHKEGFSYAIGDRTSLAINRDLIVTSLSGVRCTFGFGDISGTRYLYDILPESFTKIDYSKI